ncbi:replication initiation factor domain-containing protein [Methylomonas sp. 11b]|uniref:replication initiation factor domain-containing protein n=1 Tax=Methylomonas sp. 11b TaxID=1168169 RepID=UPI00047E7D37|nr:replication initiation factor domain-containing protein [Methylomonas sp. 11b]
MNNPYHALLQNHQPPPEHQAFHLLLAGLDTVECAYFLAPGPACSLDFERLTLEKETLRQKKSRDPKLINLGDIEFMLQPYGSSSGYPFVISNQDFTIAFGEYNTPAFFVKFRSFALWHQSASALHQSFLNWAQSLGFFQLRPESLSRVDFTFDYALSEINFDENHFVSQSKKDNRFRKDQQIQTLQFGKGDVVLRVYDKRAEIEEQSHKTWFQDLWNTESEKVWRIEWQVRKEILKRFSIRSFKDLQDGTGDILRYLANEHDSLKMPTTDSNRARWPLHPLWQDLIQQIGRFNAQGVYRSIDPQMMLDERLTRIAISMYGYLKRIAAIDCVQKGKEMISYEDAIKRIARKMELIHDPLTWETDVEKRINQIRLGQW